MRARFWLWVATKALYRYADAEQLQVVDDDPAHRHGVVVLRILLHMMDYAPAKGIDFDLALAEAKRLYAEQKE